MAANRAAIDAGQAPVAVPHALSQPQGQASASAQASASKTNSTTGRRLYPDGGGSSTLASEEMRRIKQTEAQASAEELKIEDKPVRGGGAKRYRIKVTDILGEHEIEEIKGDDIFEADS